MKPTVITVSSKLYLQTNFKSLLRSKIKQALFLAVNSYLMLLYLRVFQHQEKKSWVPGQTVLSSEVQVHYCCSLQAENKL